MTSYGTDTHQVTPPVGDLDPIYSTWFLGPIRLESSSQTASQSVQRFSHGSRTWPTDRQTDRQTDHATLCCFCGSDSLKIVQKGDSGWMSENLYLVTEWLPTGTHSQHNVPTVVLGLLTIFKSIISVALESIWKQNNIIPISVYVRHSRCYVAHACAYTYAITVCIDVGGFVAFGELLILKSTLHYLNRNCYSMQHVVSTQLEANCLDTE